VSRYTSSETKRKKLYRDAIWSDVYKLFQLDAIPAYFSAG